MVTLARTLKSANDTPLPTTFEEAVEALDTIIDEMDRDALGDITGGMQAFLRTTLDAEDAAIDVHHSLGQQLRNQWKLWADPSPLKAHMSKRFDIQHPDDMSHRIIVAYIKKHQPDPPSVWERLNNA